MGALIPAGVTRTDASDYPPLTDVPIEPPVPPYRDATPVVYGHYWRPGNLSITGPTTACVDYPAGKGGPLVAYRWSGEQELSGENFFSAG